MAAWSPLHEMENTFASVSRSTSAVSCHAAAAQGVVSSGEALVEPSHVPWVDEIIEKVALISQRLRDSVAAALDENQEASANGDLHRIILEVASALDELLTTARSRATSLGVACTAAMPSSQAYSPTPVRGSRMDTTAADQGEDASAAAARILLPLSVRVACLEAQQEERLVVDHSLALQLQRDVDSLEQQYFAALRHSLVLPASMRQRGGARGSNESDDEFTLMQKLLDERTAALQNSLADAAAREEVVCAREARVAKEAAQINAQRAKVDADAASLHAAFVHCESVKADLRAREAALAEKVESTAAAAAALSRERASIDELIATTKPRIARDEERAIRQLGRLSQAAQLWASVDPSNRVLRSLQEGSTAAPIDASDAARVEELDSSIKDLDRQVHALMVRKIAAEGQRDRLLSLKAVDKKGGPAARVGSRGPAAAASRVSSPPRYLAPSVLSPNSKQAPAL